MRQLVLDLPVEPAFGTDDFLVGPANSRAFGLVEAWPDWPDRLLVIRGPAGSGKSHLAAIWAERAGASTTPATALRPEHVPRLSAGTLVVEDLHRGLADEAALFHLLNIAREQRRFVVLTSSFPVDRLGLRTQDLVSRLRLAPLAELGMPDDALLRAVLVKLFHDRQVTVDAGVVEFLANRMERSFAAAVRIVAALDREALSRGRRVTRQMAGIVLGELASAGEA